MMAINTILWYGVVQMSKFRGTRQKRTWLLLNMVGYVGH